MNRSHIIYACAIGLALTACSGLMGNLRRDLDDGGPASATPESPTVGGRWTERGFLGDDMSDGGPYSDKYNVVGHSERSLASDGGGGSAGNQGWISPDQAEANRRDAYRNGTVEEGMPAVSFSGNPNVLPPVERMYKNGSRATRADFVDASENEGSLWASNGQTNYYFTKNKVRGVGDIITINLEPDLIHDISMEIKKTLNEREKEVELTLASERQRNKLAGLDDTKDATGATRAPASTPAPGASPVAPVNIADIPAPTLADIDVAKSLEVKAGDPMMGEIVERYPNGNYKIRSVKKVPYKNGGARLVSLVAVAKNTDIGDDDTVPSSKLYEYRVEAAK